MIKHTPGPWRLYPIHDEHLDGIKEDEFAIMGPSLDLKQRAEPVGCIFGVTPKDASLIAAAPDLLDACKEALNMREKNCLGDIGVSAQLRSVIAKAEGKS